MFEPGTQVGRYEIQRRLGRGGMGTVFVAHDPVLGRMVAIKIFAGDLDVPDARERFSREARAAAALNHPNIVTVYDFGEFESQPYIVMEYVPGETLSNLIRRKVVVSMADKLRWMEELCAGAGYAHQMSVVHRDLKPANLMIDRSGRLKILDFGIARMLGIASNTGVMIGTPGYMAPEQITGDPVDHRTDQFSIGVVFYELLSYTEPFPGDSLPMITHRIVSQEPTPLEQLVPDASPELVAIINTALKKSSAQRFRDAEMMRIAIGRVRREYESDADWNTPTMPVGRDFAPPAGGSRGTGSARRRTNESVGVAQLTPPPDPRRTDREALARRRTTQLEAALLLSRTLLEQGQLEDAMEACQQALTLDETHVGALELEQEIDTAIRIREGVEIAADDGAVTTASDPSGLDPGLAASRLLQSEAVTRLTPASSEPRLTIPVAELSGGLSEVDDRAVVRRAVAPEATIAPVRPTPAHVPAPAPAAPAVAKALRGGVGIAAIAVAGLGVFMFTRGPAPTGIAVIDAVPWAIVTAIQNEDGEPQSLPSPASTPFALALPAGTYQVTLTGPPPESRTETVSVRIDVGGTSVVPTTRFQGVSVEEYFEMYLGSGDAPTAAPTAPAPVGTAAPAPAPASTGVAQ